ncbi:MULTISPECIES: helix-turn-helix domain-containing protein [Streptomyces]|uniref:Helix-turn-helix transcriptional regulator n=1 Tax=Streptomyces evansiae TaxID=3075535 RepID=A0ABU2R7I2_9ACTN|nr:MULTISPECIES: helix-turn-helix transcriptional regulator [unclassified Streptomyces]MDT0412652.1 helix-turn-helix transcriptional regulator [Streptomyces sp. DSM 41979]MYQ55748.1 helix-turn-helix domain-containing protein [Streptomyces sp. SID4926]
MDGPTENLCVDAERLRRAREARHLSRPQLASLLGVSPEWVKKAETGERVIDRLPMLYRLCRVLGLSDVSELTGGQTSMPVATGGRLVHPGVEELRRAVHAPLFVQEEPEDVGVLAGRVAQTWAIWHGVREQRTAVAAVLPDLIRTGHATMRAAEGPEKRRAAVVLSEVYALAQQYAAHITDPPLYWTLVDRARMLAEQADDVLALAGAAWVTGNGLRAAGDTEGARRVAADAAETLERSIEDGSDRLRGLYGSLCLHVALSAAQERREGDAWHWWDKADRAAARLGTAYMHPWTAFGEGNVAVHGVSIAADLGAYGTALQRMSEVDPETIPSVERRSRLYLDAARGERARHQVAAALTYLRLAVATSPEAVRYAPAGRALAEDLARTAPAPLRRAAHDVASLVGVPAA